MSFLYPTFLWALFAVSIPIIIHFFNFRSHKTVYFSNVAFLQNIEQENKSRNQLKDILILIFRILTIVALVVAFANPVKLNKNINTNKNCPNNYGIYIDNSFSMNALSANGKILDLAKTKATDVVAATKQNSKFFYITNQLDAQQQHLYIKDIVLDNISTTNNSSQVRKMSEIFSRFNHLFKNENYLCDKKIFIISDFQKNCFDENNFVFDTLTKVYLLPVEPNETANLFIDSVWFESPFHLYNSPDSLVVKIKNNSNQDYQNQQLYFYVNDTLKTISTYNVSANSTQDVKVRFTNTSQGFLNGQIKIDDLLIEYDNSIFFNYYIAPKVEVLLIEGKANSYLTEFYNDNTYFNLTTASISNIPVVSFANYQAIVLSSVEKISTGVLNELKKYIENGGIVLFIPKNSAKITDLNQITMFFDLPSFTNKKDFDLKISKINTDDNIFLDVFDEIKDNSLLPKTKSYFRLNPNTLSDYATLLSAENDDKILIYKEIQNGMFYMFTTDLNKENSDFMTNPLCTPTLYNIPVFAKSDNKIYHTIGNTNSIELKNVDLNESIKLVNTQNQFEFIINTSKIGQNKLKFSTENVNLTAGNYQIKTNSGTQIGAVSFNYDRTESDLENYTEQDLKEYVKRNNLDWVVTTKTGEFLQNEIISSQSNKNMAKIFIILALIFILAEILTVRLLKN